MTDSDSIADTSINDVSSPETGSDPQPNQQDVATNGGSSLVEKLLADAPDDDGTYTDHALNFDGKESTAKIIRGAEGFFGNMDKALLLIGIGVVQKFQEEFGNSEEEQDDEEIGQELEPQGETV